MTLVVFFQGEKNEGFGVLYANMKCGIIAIKELADFLKERAKLEEENSKAHAKLSKQVNLRSKDYITNYNVFFLDGF